MEYITIFLFLSAVFEIGCPLAPPPEVEQGIAVFLPSRTPIRPIPTPAELEKEALKVKVTPLSPALKSAQQYLKWIQSSIHPPPQSFPLEEVQRSKITSFSNPKGLTPDPAVPGDLTPEFQIGMDPGIYPPDPSTQTGLEPNPLFNPSAPIRINDKVNSPGLTLLGETPGLTLPGETPGLTLLGETPGIYPADPGVSTQFVLPVLIKIEEKPPDSFAKIVEAVKTNENLHKLQNQKLSSDMHQQLETKQNPFHQSKKMLVSTANGNYLTTSTNSAMEQQYSALWMNMLKIPQLPFTSIQNSNQTVKQRRAIVTLPQVKQEMKVQQMFGPGRDKVVTRIQMNRDKSTPLSRTLANVRPNNKADIQPLLKQPALSRPNSQPMRHVNAQKQTQQDFRSVGFNPDSTNPVVLSYPMAPVNINEKLNPPTPPVTPLTNKDTRSTDLLNYPLIQIQNIKGTNRLPERPPNQTGTSLLDQINEAKKRKLIQEQFNKQPMPGFVEVKQDNENRKRLTSTRDMKRALFDSHKKPPPKQTFDTLVQLRSEKPRSMSKFQAEALSQILSQLRTQSQLEERQPKPGPSQPQLHKQSQHQLQSQTRLQTKPKSGPDGTGIPKDTTTSSANRIRLLSLSKSMDVSKLSAPRKPAIITEENYRTSPKTAPFLDETLPLPLFSDRFQIEQPREINTRELLEQYLLTEQRRVHPSLLGDSLNAYQPVLGSLDPFLNLDRLFFKGRESQGVSPLTQNKFDQNEKSVQISESQLQELLRVYALQKNKATTATPSIQRRTQPQTDISTQQASTGSTISSVPFSDSQIQYIIGLLNSRNQTQQSTQKISQGRNSVPQETISGPNSQRPEDNRRRSFEQMPGVDHPNDKANFRQAPETVINPEQLQRLSNGLTSLGRDHSDDQRQPATDLYQASLLPGYTETTKSLASPGTGFQEDQKSQISVIKSIPAFHDGRRSAQDLKSSYPVPPNYEQQSLIKPVDKRSSSLSPQTDQLSSTYKVGIQPQAVPVPSIGTRLLQSVGLDQPQSQPQFNQQQYNAQPQFQQEKINAQPQSQQQQINAQPQFQQQPMNEQPQFQQQPINEQPQFQQQQINAQPQFQQQQINAQLQFQQQQINTQPQFQQQQINEHLQFQQQSQLEFQPQFQPQPQFQAQLQPQFPQQSQPQYQQQLQPQFQQQLQQQQLQPQPQSDLVLTTEQYLALDQVLNGNNNMGVSQYIGYV